MAIKILIGGSPCTYWSIAQTNNRETKAEGMGWELFKNYLIAKEKFKPDFFLYENNKSAAQAIKDQIAEELGVGVDPDVRFTYINSALVSAQNRQRFYVTNFGDIEQPEDRGILLKDILETGCDLTSNDKSYCLTASYDGACAWNTIERSQRSMVAEPVLVPPCDPLGRDKARTMTAGYQTCSQRDLRMDIESNGFMGKQGAIEPVYIGAVPENNGTYLNGKQPSQQYRIYDTNAKGVAVTTAAITNVAEPVRAGCMPSPDGTIKNSQAKRIYKIDGKSVNLVANGGGKGAKTGLYAIPVNTTVNDKSYALTTSYYKCAENPFSEFGEEKRRPRVAELVGYAKPVEWDDDGKPIKAVSCADGKTYTVYEVIDKKITIREKQYDINLSDGFYIIRKLTVRECARLQTMPDDYCRSVSNAQAYKALGNGWTAEVIIHLLHHALKDVPKDEEIIVLSMYDGIATGRCCLDKMGFTNVTYHAYEIDKYPIKIAMDNYPDIIQHGDAFAVREEDWEPPRGETPLRCKPNTQALDILSWLDEVTRANQ